MILVPDTNILIHCLWVTDLPFEELSEKVRVIVPHTVVREIDSLKHGPQSRRTDRARQVSDLFMRILDSEGERIAFGRKLRHSIELGPGTEEPMDGAVAVNADDHVVAEAKFLGRGGQGGVVVLTDDALLVRKAKMSGVAYLRVPSEWLQPVEKSIKDRRIEELSKRVASLEVKEPRFDVALVAIQADGQRGATAVIESGEPLTRAEADHIAVEASRKFPPDLQWKSGAAVDPLVRLPSRYDFEVYEASVYPNWQREVSEWALERSRAILRKLRAVNVVFTLENVGPVPADGLRLDIRAPSDVLILPLSADDQATLRLPRMPQRPAGPKPRRPIDGMLDGIGMPAFPDMPHMEGRKDRHAFYESTAEGEDLRSRSFEREELRHREPCELFLTLLFNEGFNQSTLDVSGRISCRNLSTPHDFNLALEVTATPIDSLFEQVLRAVRSPGPRAKSRRHDGPGGVTLTI